jgi:hypothetical protein
LFTFKDFKWYRGDTGVAWGQTLPRQGSGVHSPPEATDILRKKNTCFALKQVFMAYLNRITITGDSFILPLSIPEFFKKKNETPSPCC